MDFCLPTSYNVPMSGGGGSSMMKKGATSTDAKTSKGQIIELYPNPTKDKTEIRFTLEKKASVEINITDISGKVVQNATSKIFEQGTQRLEISTVDFPSGIYLFQIKIGNETTTKKLTVVK